MHIIHKIGSRSQAPRPKSPKPVRVERALRLILGEGNYHHVFIVLGSMENKFDET